MRYLFLVLRLVIVLSLALSPAAFVSAQDAPAPIELDEAGFGVAQMDAIDPGAQAEFTLDLVAGDRVAMDLQGEGDGLQVTAFRASYGDLVMEGVPEGFNYLAWAPEDGSYTIVVENGGDAAAGFVLRVVVSAGPLPAKKVLTADADGQTIPVTVGDPFQVALDTNGGDGYSWTLDDFDDTILEVVGDPATVLLGTMPGARSEQIFTLQAIAPGTATLEFTNARPGGATPAGTYSVTIEAAAAGDEPAPEPLTPDASGLAQATGTLDPQGMASYVVEIDAGASVQALVTPDDTNLVLTVVGADGNPLLTDHAGASNFDQVMPVSQAYTFKVINFGEATQDYAFALSVTPGAPGGDDLPTGDAALGEDLVTAYFDALQAGDADQVAALLAPAFQIVRATGERFDATTYLDNLPAIESYELSDLRVTRDGGVLVVAYMARTDTTLDDGKADLGAPAPRLTVFQEIDGAWKLLAHANFASVATADECCYGEFVAPSSQLTITEADLGKVVQVAAGGEVVVALPGNPTTGYIWQVTANDESILRPTGYAFVPDSDADGAGGVESFTFHVMAPGYVDLALANSQPWDAETPPDQTFAVTVEALNEWSGEDASITVGAADNGQSVTILPGNVLLVALEGAERGMWDLVQSDPMVAQMMGGAWVFPAEEEGTQLFKYYFLGIGPGTAELQFEFVNPDGIFAEEGYTLSVTVPAAEPGSSGAVAATEADAGAAFTLVTGDTLVVRLAANPSTGYTWRVVSTNDALLPSAGDPVFAESAEMPGAGGIDTFRFLAKAAGEATVQISEFAPGAEEAARTLDYNVTIVDPTPLTGNTVTVTAADAGTAIDVTAGDWLAVELDANPSTGYQWLVTANDGAVLRLLPESGFTASADMPGAPGMQRFVFRALTPGTVALEIGEFPPGADAPGQTLEFAVTVE
jgi:inhibitor of cysteine peptidase